MLFPTPSVRYVSAPCSTGKTLAACKYMAQKLIFSNFLYVAPTKRLLQQTLATLQGMGVRPTIIDSDTTPNVNAAIISYLKAAPDCGAVLLVTWSAYEHLSYFHRPENWIRIIDEVPQLDAFHPFRLPRNHQFLTENIEIRRSINQQIVEVGSKDHWALKCLLGKPHDEVDDHFRPLFQALLSQHKTVYVDIDSWTRIAEDHIVSEKDEEKNRIYFLAMLKPSLFRNSILLGANVEESMLYDWLKRYHGKKFVREEAIYSELRSLPANLAERLTIKHFGFPKLFSKYQANQAGDDGRAVLDRMTDVAIETFDGDPFLFTLNKDRDDKRLVVAAGTRIPAIAHGLNEYQTYTNVFFAAALNREPKHYKMLQDLGFTSKRIQQSALEVAYQGTMRSALRDFASDARVCVIVPDLPSVRYLTDSIGPCTVQQIGDLAPPARLPPLTQAQKAQRKRALEYRDQLLLPPKYIPESTINDSGILFGGSGLDGGNGSECLVTFHSKPNDFRPDQFKVQLLGYQDFIKLLRTSARALVDAKEKQYLFNGTVFKPPEGSTGYRRQEYFYCSFFIVLDFDDGKLTPDCFIDLFWKKAGAAQKRSFLICNSYSRSAEKPNRFRVMLLYRRPATSLEQHQAVYDAVVGPLAKAGYSEEAAGLDRNCRSGAQSFYMPGTNRHHQDWAFFKTFGTKTEELRRYAIDPTMYWNTATSNGLGMNSHSPCNGCTMTTAPIEELKSTIRAMKGGRHELFWKLAKQLAWQLRDEGKVRYHLMELAGSDGALQKKTRDAIASLRKYKRL
jgi:hypothetical protein